MQLIKLLLVGFVASASIVQNTQKRSSENKQLKNSVNRTIQQYNERKSQNVSSRKAVNRPSSVTPVSKMHSEAESRNLINYASAAYCQREMLTNWGCANCNGPTTGSSEVTYFSDDNVGSAGYSAINKNQKLIVFSYRGTNDIYNWLYNLNIDLVPAGLNGTNKDAEIHEGFSDMANSLLDQTTKALKLAIGKYPDYKLMFTGHSLGGAIATLTAFKLAESKVVGWEKLNVITYGQPRVGNPKFASYLVSKPWIFTRITSYSDIVPISPGMSMGYYHNQHNMHINEEGQTVACSPYQEDDKCIDDFWIPSIDAHFNYWNLTINSDCI